MKWISLKELVEKTGLYQRTVTRRIQKMRERDPLLYSAIVDDSNIPRLYKDPQVTSYVLLRSNVVNPNKKDRQNKRPQDIRSYHYRRKARQITETMDEKVKTILSEPVEYDFDQEAKDLYALLRTEADRIKFEASVRILQDYKFMNITLDQACRRHGADRRKFYHWTKSVGPIERLYIKARLTRAREEEDHLAEVHEQTIHITSQGYEIVLPVVEIEVRRDAFGNIYKIPIRERQITKHVPRNLNAAIFWLTNKRKDEWARYHAPTPPEAPEAEYIDPEMKELEGKTPEELLQILKETKQKLDDLKSDE